MAHGGLQNYDMDVATAHAPHAPRKPQPASHGHLCMGMCALVRRRVVPTHVHTCHTHRHTRPATHDPRLVPAHTTLHPHVTRPHPTHRPRFNTHVHVRFSTSPAPKANEAGPLRSAWHPTHRAFFSEISHLSRVSRSLASLVRLSRPSTDHARSPVPAAGAAPPQDTLCARSQLLVALHTPLLSPLVTRL